MVECPKLNTAIKDRGAVEMSRLYMSGCPQHPYSTKGETAEADRGEMSAGHCREDPGDCRIGGVLYEL